MSNGFLGEDDGWTDLKDDYRLDQHNQPGDPATSYRRDGLPG